MGSTAWTWEQTAADGWLRIAQQTREYSRVFHGKLAAMQEDYLLRFSDRYSRSETEEVRYQLKAVLHKFHLAAMSLEYLHAVSLAKVASELVLALELSLDTLEVDEDELVLLSYGVESALFQCNAFLDFYMLYIGLLLKGMDRCHMSREKFLAMLQRMEGTPSEAKAAAVHEYFTSNVFASRSEPKRFVDPAWGCILTSLRDRVAHRDLVRPSFESDRRLAGDVLLDWPTLRGRTYDDFIQMLQNGMWDLAGPGLAPVLYETDWQAGPWRWDPAAIG